MDAYEIQRILCALDCRRETRAVHCDGKLPCSALGEKQKKPEDHDGNQGQHDVEEHLPDPGSAALFPIPQFGPVFDAYFVLMLQVMRKLAAVGVAILGIALEGAVNNLLQLRRDIGSSSRGGMGLFSSRSFMMAKGLGPEKGLCR